MGKRLTYYLRFLEEKSHADLSQEERILLKENLLYHIRIFQHERLVHLIVTVTFALLATLSILCSLFYQGILLDGAVILLLLLTIPYIWHYFVLENGVQKLYAYFDKIQEQIIAFRKSE